MSNKEVIIMSCSCFRPSSVGKKSSAHDDIDSDLLESTKRFSYDELISATENFHSSNKIGQGGFGIVYKFLLETKRPAINLTARHQSAAQTGTLRSGRRVAVKKLSAESKQGVREFLTEIKTISNVKHPSLVELIGCCVQGTNRILVYEYVENNSLDRALLGRNANIKLDWEKRYGICIGTAKGLQFLHEELDPRIVHRDIKSSNILLDKDFNPKIGDFGLAKLFPDNITHISTRVAGTTGYLAPEYVMGGQLTMKADVYSFGVLILEVICGKSSGKANWGGLGKFLLEWVWELHEDGKLLEAVDPELVEYPGDEVIRFMKVALFCTQGVSNRRPLMTQVVDMLTKNVRLNEKLLAPPGFFKDSGLSGVPLLHKNSMAATSYQMSSVSVTLTQITPR